jgi:hypothetical protein
MRTPAIAGPATIPIVIRNDESAPAAAISLRSTRRGVSASSEGRWSPSSIAIRAASAKITQSLGCGRSAFATSTAEAAAKASSVICIIRRRSTASAMAPPTSALPRSGTSSTTPRSPTTSDEWVISYAWNGNAT